MKDFVMGSVVMFMISLILTINYGNPIKTTTKTVEYKIPEHNIKKETKKEEFILIDYYLDDIKVGSYRLYNNETYIIDEDEIILVTKEKYIK